MPFIEKKRRKPMLEGQLKDITPGDLCYEKYQQIMDAWDKENRWRTVDKIAESIMPGSDSRAMFLAFLVFFHLHAMKYEAKMRKKNGDVRGRKK